MATMLEGKIKNVANFGSRMVGTKNQQNVSPDRMLCATEGCYGLAMIADKKTMRYKKLCAACNNPSNQAKDDQHTYLYKATKLKTMRCYDCGKVCPTTVDQPFVRGVTIEIHHVNGNHFDNRKSNLRALCCNCHLNNYTIPEAHSESYEIRFDMTRDQMRDVCKKNRLYYYNPNA